MKFLNAEHEQRFVDLTTKGKGVHQDDSDRRYSLYVISGNEYLYQKASKLYNFEKGYFIVDEDDNNELIFKCDLSSSERALMKLAISMFTGDSYVGVLDLFKPLDESNRELAHATLQLRY